MVDRNAITKDAPREGLGRMSPDDLVIRELRHLEDDERQRAGNAEEAGDPITAAQHELYVWALEQAIVSLTGTEAA